MYEIMESSIILALIMAKLLANVVVVGGSTILIYSNLNSIRHNKIRLHRINKYQGCKVKELSLVDSKSITELKQEVNKEKEATFLEYINKLKNYTSEDNLKTLYRNLNTLEVEHGKNFILSFLGAGGAYTARENKIIYEKNKFLGHEFLHFCSSYVNQNEMISVMELLKTYIQVYFRVFGSDRKILLKELKQIVKEEIKEAYGGFYQVHDDISLGKGLDEGYTELLASRIYNHGKIMAYKKEVKIAKLLEFFFDNPKDMENYYFNHDLNGFVHHMEKFTSRENIIQLISEIDSMNKLQLPWYLPNYIKVQLKLYEWFNEKNNDLEKLQQFKDLICKNKIVSIALKSRKIKLQRVFQRGRVILEDTKEEQELKEETVSYENTEKRER